MKIMGDNSTQGYATISLICVHNQVLKLIFLFIYFILLSKWSAVAERSNALDSSSGVVGMWVRIPAWPVAGTCVLEQGHLTKIASSFGWGRKAVGPRVLCNACKRTWNTYREREGGLGPVFSGFAPWAPSRVDMCALEIFCIIINIIKISKCCYFSCKKNKTETVLNHQFWHLVEVNREHSILCSCW